MDAPINDTAEQVYISSLALLKVKNSSCVSCYEFVDLNSSLFTHCVYIPFGVLSVIG